MNKTPKQKVEPDLGLIPEKGTTYWYVRSCMLTHRFKVWEAEFFGGMGDMLRLAKGNIYFNVEEAEKIALLMNKRLDCLLKVINDKREEIEREKKLERAKAELAKKKKEIKTQTPPKKEKQIKIKPKKRIHPDILD